MSAPPLPPVLSPRSIQLVMPTRPATGHPPPPQSFFGRRSSTSASRATSSTAAVPPPLPYEPPQPTSFTFNHSRRPSNTTGDGMEGQPWHQYASSSVAASNALTPTHSSRPTPLLMSQHRQDGLVSQLLKMGFTAAVAERATVDPAVVTVEMAVERALQAQEEEEEAHEAGHAQEDSDEKDEDEAEEKEGLDEASVATSQPATTTQRHSPSAHVTISIDDASASLSPAAQWQCMACTFHNAMPRRRCEVCNTRRPNTESATIPTPTHKPAPYVEPVVDTTTAAAADSNVQLSNKPCQICFERVPVDDMLPASCSHAFCRPCMAGYLTSKVNDGLVLNVPCPFPKCSRVLPSSDFLALLPADLHDKYERFRLNAEVALDADARWCPTPGCNTVLKHGKGSAGDRLKCGTCKTSICFRCNEMWHDGRTCEQAANGVMAAYRKSHDVKQCPKCQTTIERSEGCNHMTCTRCHFQFCWLCSGHYTRHHFAFWNLLGCPGLQDGSLSWLGNDNVCCFNCGCGCGCAGVVKRLLFRLWVFFTIGVSSVILAVPMLLGGLVCGPCLCWRYRKQQRAKRERRERREAEREERRRLRRLRALARFEIDETGRVLSPEERRERRRLAQEKQEKQEMEEALRLSLTQLDETVAGRVTQTTAVAGGIVGTARAQPVSILQLAKSPRDLQMTTLGDLPLSSPGQHVIQVT